MRDAFAAIKGGDGIEHTGDLPDCAAVLAPTVIGTPASGGGPAEAA
jgi:hypothetical protein